MAGKIIELCCPGCGARVSVNQIECEYCHEPIVISTFDSVFAMSATVANKHVAAYREALAEDPDHADLNRSIAMCYLRLKLYGKARVAFEKVIEQSPGDSDAYFYAAICILDGKRPFMSSKTIIDQAEQYANAALQIEGKGIYYYLLSYIRYDYFYMKRLNASPSYSELLQMALQAGLSAFDVEQLYEILGTSKPDCL